MVTRSADSRGRDCARLRCTLTASASQLPQLSRIPERPIKQNKVVFLFNFFDELRRLAPASK